MSWWKKLFGGSKAAPTPQPGGLGTIDSSSTILLDSGLAVRIPPDEPLAPGLARGQRVAVERLEVQGAVTFARGVSPTTQPFVPSSLRPGTEIVPPRAPPPPSPAELEARRREAEAGRARARAEQQKRRQQWREARLALPLDALRTELQDRLEPHAALLPVNELLSLARPAVQAVGFEGETGAAEGSRLGGQPLLPKRAAWPEKNGQPLAFLAQWRLSEVPRTLAGLNLPQSGHLLFFYDAVGQPWGFEPADRGSWAVIHVEDGAGSLRPFPEKLPAEARFPEAPLAFGPKLTIPHPFAERYPGRAGRSDEANDAAWDLVGALEQAAFGFPGHQIGGWPTLIQDDMEQECQLVSSGVRMGSPKDREATYRPGMEKGAEDWVLLFQIDSDEEGPGWMWGDSGMLYFWIRKQDLAARDFNKVWVVLQCT